MFDKEILLRRAGATIQEVLWKIAAKYTDFNTGCFSRQPGFRKAIGNCLLLKSSRFVIFRKLLISGTSH